ncbi:hypothetical protein GCM10009533_36950 [Saccharopolyspora spinosporotrichia]|uniref:Transposase n=1 Tax=Saccharopolyspora erythraea TaxID=1836 RepID=A0ABN1D547_SACER
MPTAVTCGVLGISRQAYCQWCADPVSQRDWDDAHLLNAALDIHAHGVVLEAMPGFHPLRGLPVGGRAELLRSLVAVRPPGTGGSS